ncbi:MAG: thiamine diphosphokinase [Candidatus Cloacimonadota bacterium]|nr:MAG: thiamine diphosphokinase [Candidatus Cloacimonadota bacterium]
MLQDIKKAILVTFFEKEINPVIWEKFRKDAFLIAVDGGADLLIELGEKPDLMTGDFDSVSRKANELFRDVKRLEFPAEKDFTDTELAIEYAYENNFREIIAINSLNGRPDQIYGLLSHFRYAKKKNIDLLISDTVNHIFTVRKSEIINLDINSTVSLIPLTEEAEVVSTSGLKYPLSNEKLYNYKNRGISNVAIKEEIKIETKKGILLATVASKDKFLRK